MSDLTEEYDALENQLLGLYHGTSDEDAWPNAVEALNNYATNVRNEAIDHALSEARKVISQYLASAEKWRYDKVMWAFAIMLGEIPEDSTEPEAPRLTP